MLVRTLNDHETIHIGDGITVRRRLRSQRYPEATVIECGDGVKVVLFNHEHDGQLRVGIEAPENVTIWRTEREAECTGKNVT